MNLTFSVILKPSFLSISDLFYLNIFSSLAIHDYLLERGNRPVFIKWPNDIYVNDKKLCGILAENQLKGSQLNCAVIGVGLNVNQQEFSVDIATSLSLLSGRKFDLQEELEALLSMIEARYLQLKQNKLSKLLADYLGALYWFNEVHHFRASGEVFEGIICGVDQSGKLLVRVDNVVRLYDVKEIVYER